MKKIKSIIWKILVFVGVFGYNLISANDGSIIMNYEDEKFDMVNSLLGLDDEDSGDYDDDEDIDVDPDIELEGLGRMMRRSGGFKRLNAFNRIRKIRHNYRRRLYQKSRNSIISPTQRFIVGSKNKYGATTQKMMANKELTFSNGGIYYVKNYSKIAGNLSIIHSNDTIGVGYSNLLENGIVPKGKIVAVNYLSLEANQYGGTDMFSSQFIPVHNSTGLENSEIELVVNGTVVLAVPVFMMCEARVLEKSCTDSTLNRIGINLEKPILIKPDDRINFNLKMPEGKVYEPPASTNRRIGLRFNLLGSGTRIK